MSVGIHHEQNPPKWGHWATFSMCLLTSAWISDEVNVVQLDIRSRWSPRPRKHDNKRPNSPSAFAPRVFHPCSSKMERPPGPSHSFSYLSCCCFLWDVWLEKSCRRTEWGRRIKEASTRSRCFLTEPLFPNETSCGCFYVKLPSEKSFHH